MSHVLGLSCFADDGHFFTNWEFPQSLICLAESTLFTSYFPLPTSHFPSLPGRGAVNSFIRCVSYLLLSWRCRAPSPEWPSLRSFEPLGCRDRNPRLISHSWCVASGRAAEAFQFSARELAVKGKQSAASLCAGSVFTRLHRCMSSTDVLVFIAFVYSKSAGKTVEVNLG